MSLSIGIQEQYGSKEGLFIVNDNKIVEWPYDAPKPTTAEKTRLRLAGKKILLIADIKKLAAEKILKIAPAYKQRNALSEAALRGDNSALVALWSKIDMIRSYSNLLEETVKSSEDLKSIDLITGWPF
jgi:hypothetical protein